MLFCMRWDLFFIPLGFFKSLPNLEAYSELVI